MGDKEVVGGEGKWEFIIEITMKSQQNHNEITMISQWNHNEITMKSQ